MEASENQLVYDLCALTSGNCWLGLRLAAEQALGAYGESTGLSKTLTMPQWTDDSPYNFTAWQPGEPEVPVTDLCTVVSNSVPTAADSWRAIACTQQQPFVCKVPRQQPGSGGSSPAGPPVGVYTADSVYMLYNQVANQSDAQQHCQHVGGNLASIRGPAENKVVGELCSKAMAAGQGCWVGITVNQTAASEPGAYHQLMTWTSGDVVNYTAWQPDTGGAVEGMFCGVMKEATDAAGNTLYLWDMADCSQLLSFVCELPTVVPAPPPPPSPPIGTNGTTIVQPDGSSWVVYDRASFADAEQQCQLVSGHLASVRSEADNAFVASLCKQLPAAGSGSKCWLGMASWVDTGAPTSWLDGAPVTYTAWGGVTAPSADPTLCTALDMDAMTWSIEPCAVKMPFACRLPPVGPPPAPDAPTVQLVLKTATCTVPTGPGETVRRVCWCPAHAFCRIAEGFLVRLCMSCCRPFADAALSVCRTMSQCQAPTPLHLSATSCSRDCAWQPDSSNGIPL